MVESVIGHGHECILGTCECECVCICMYGQQLEFKTQQHSMPTIFILYSKMRCMPFTNVICTLKNYKSFIK